MNAAVVAWFRPTVLITLLSLFALGPGSAADALRDGFLHPPHPARPWVYWFWMDGNVSREGITADLESMQRAGLGGLVLMEVDVGVPRGSVRFMSEPWQELFAHAVREAERLGLEITLNAGPGWTGSGGPWVKPDQSMQHLVASTIQITGPTNLDVVLPQPAPRDPHFVHAPVPASLRAVREQFYRDVAVLAFPTPADGPRIADSDEKALYYRNPYSSSAGVKPFLAAPANHPDAPADTLIAPERALELTHRLQANGRIMWEVPPGNWTIMRFGRTSTGANTRPAPEPGIGLESDKFDPAALDAHFADYVGVLLKRIGPRPATRKSGWTMLHIDSWEMGAQNWTARFRDEFQRRRGYDPLPFLPAMMGRTVGSAARSERFLWDIRQTAQELVIEYHAGHLKTLGRRHGFGLSIEPYDMNPCSDLSLGGVADIPMCEFWAKGYGFDSSFSCFESVSIAHTRGRPIVAAEAFTSDDAEAWRLHPGAMKAQADWAFATGINRLVIHRYAHQPWPDRRPGMTMGPYGAHYERTQTWWDLVPAWHDYLARCQFLLQQGLPVADICYIAPEGAPHVFRPPQSAVSGPQPLPDRRGYNFDGCAPETVLDRMSVRDGRVILPDGMSYRLLVLPEMETITPALLRKVAKLVRSGATILGPRPLQSPSLSGFPDCDTEVARLARALWPDASSGSSAEMRTVGKGRIFRSHGPNPSPTPASAPARLPNSTQFPDLYASYEQAASILAGMNVPPDFESDATLRYTHRRAGRTDIYFIANGSTQAVSARCMFRVEGRQPERWDPMTGIIRPLPEFTSAKGRTTVPLTFDPSGSCFIVFRQTERRPLSARHERIESRNPESAIRNPQSAIRNPQSAIQTVTGPWTIRFESGRGAPEVLTFAELIDWSTHPDAAVRHFSGLATYTARFEVPPGAERPRWIDLGRVAVMARVRLNGKPLGTAWIAPFRLDLGDAVQAGSNTLEITVANLWPNRLIGDRSVPEAQRITWTTWNPYKAGAPLLESGLLGPVTLQKTGNGVASK